MNEKLIDKIVENAREKHMPVNGAIELLPLCNMNCQMCYVRLDKQDVDNNGGLRTYEEWIKIAEEMKEAGVLVLLLTGGEPLLYPRFKELYVTLRKMGFIVSINSNGTLMDDEWIDFFVKYPPRRMNITLYGNSNETYKKLCHHKTGYDKTIYAIEKLVEHNILLKLNVTPVPENKDEIVDIIKYANKIKVPIAFDRYMNPPIYSSRKINRLTPKEAAELYFDVLSTIDSEDDYRKYIIEKVALADYLEEHPVKEESMTCLARSASFSINWKGELQPCLTMHEKHVSLLDHSFSEAWHMLQQELQSVTLNEKCRSCNIKHLCKTCVASAYLETGNYDGLSDYVCDMAHEVEKIFREKAKEYSSK